MTYQCCICKRIFEGKGNNPWPLKDKGKCCNYCNGEVVLSRLALRDELEKQNPTPKNLQDK